MAASPLIMMVLMFAVFYFILIRPQIKKQKQHAAMLSALSKGEYVVTRGGLIGKISGTAEQFLTLEIQEKVRVRVMRSHIDAKIDVSALKSGDAESKAA
ncbi:MAG TPA: preprotein translocase subunit YajC [Kofleriaceae bacterium]|nr:preprotein translocase subunit YajC [Kofleriaceae bacterium]